MQCETCQVTFEEDYRRDPTLRKTPPRFCSRTCANKNANKRYTDEEHFCKECGTSLGRGWKARQTFCSKTCVASSKAKEALSQWLESGQIPNWTGGESVNAPKAKFVRSFIQERQGDCCAICSKPAVWEGKPLVFVLDHIDGDARNNAPSNLRLICPNCNSQTDTFSGRNKGKGNR